MTIPGKWGWRGTENGDSEFFEPDDGYYDPEEPEGGDDET